MIDTSPVTITVCQFPEYRELLPKTWADLTAHVAKVGSDLVLLPELPFSRWLCALDQVDPALWHDAVAEHEQWLARFTELGNAVVASSRPVVDAGSCFNEGFIWSTAQGYRAVHRKVYLPNEPGFYEARWYEAAEKHFEVVDTPLGNVGFLLCTELWFTEWARAYARQNIRFLLCPRASEGAPEKWLVGGRAAAIMSGAWCLSSNRGGVDAQGCSWAGAGWVIDPDGEVRGVTGDAAPFVTFTVDAAAADRAKQTYPRYVLE